MDMNFDELEKLSAILSKMEDIDDLILNANNDDEKKKLENQKQEYLLQVEELYLERKIRKEGYTEEVIKSCAALRAKKNLLKQQSLEEEKKEEQEKYNLSSEYIVSNKTGETIGVKYMNLSEKIETIYEHTGQIISSQDSVINKYRDDSCAEFISFLERTNKKSELKEKYGDNWKERVAELYTQGYNDAMQRHIEKIVEKVDNKNNTKTVSTTEKKEESVEVLQQENEQLKTELSEAHTRIEELVEEISNIKQENKDTLQASRDALANMVKTNANSEIEFEYTPYEKQKIVQALGIRFEYDETKRNGVGIDNDFKLIVDEETSIEQTARQMMICKNLGISVTATFNDHVLSNQDFVDEKQVVDGYMASIDSHKKM